MADQVGTTRLAGLGLLVALAVASIAYVSYRPGGHIETAGGSVCEWRTEGDVTQDRSLILNCKCPNGAKYACKYVGKPDLTCPPIWRDFFDFFKQLRSTIKGQTHGCDLAEITSAHITLCSDSEDFKMRRQGDHTPTTC